MSTPPAQPSYGKYLLIWALLITLLAAGTFISYLPISKTAVVLLILGVALLKTGLVALFYMHLKFEPLAPVWMVVIFPFFLVGLAVLMIFLGLSFA